MAFGAAQLSAEEQDPSSTGRVPCRILVVDDSRHKLLSIEAILGELGYELVLVDSGEAALRQLLTGAFAAILLDIKMPGMDGFETARLIRSRRSSEHTPIIFMTAYAEAEADMTRAYSLGAVDFIFAPFIPEILRAKVSVFADLHLKSVQVERQAEAMRREAESRADALAMRLDGLLNTLKVGVFQAELDGGLISANPAFSRLLGQPGGRRWLRLQDIFLDPEDFRAMQAEFRQAGQVRSRAVQLRRFDGSSVWVLWTQIVSDDQRRPLIEGLIEDISDQKRAEDALIEKSEELARSNAQLEHFAYAASHDMQEPLRTISLVASMLRSEYDGVLDEHGRHWLDLLSQCSHRICTMIRDVLAFARAGQSGLSHETVDASRLLERVLFNLGESIREAEAEVEVQVEGAIFGNGTLLEQLFQNLIGNAIKFRGRDRARVSVAMEPQGSHWMFGVRDNGIGIPADHRENVFRLFHRLHDHHRYQGSGIGLALCRKIVEHHGGRIWVESEEGVGSTFSFTLPKADSGRPF